MSDYTIYALKISDDMRVPIMAALKGGEGRFGWSYVETADLRSLKQRADAGEKLTEDEWNCAQWFLLELKEGDYVVYINTPEYGQCTLAKVTGAYFWKWGEDVKDFSHRFPVDPASIQTFDRNDPVVGNHLSSRLKLQGRYWRVYAQSDFETMLAALKEAKPKGDAKVALEWNRLGEEFGPALAALTERIHHHFPAKTLEEACKTILERVPGVLKVVRLQGLADKGADLLMHMESGVPGLQANRLCVVQVKSYGGDHDHPRAVEDIERAMEFHKEATMGLIISTAKRQTKDFDEALEKARERVKKPIGLIIGADVARLFLQYGQDLLGVRLQ